MTEFEDLLKEMKKVSRILTLTNAKTVEAELCKIVTTPERKKMWVLMDGIRKPKDLSALVKVTPMAVSYFLSAAVSAGLVEYKPGEAPQRALDYVPPAWIELTKLRETEIQASQGATMTRIEVPESNATPKSSPGVGKEKLPEEEAKPDV